MHRTPLGDLGETDALLVGEGSGELERALDVIEPHGTILALLLIGSVRATVMQSYDHALEWPLLAIGVHAQRHGSAGA